MSKRPNIVFIFADQHRHDALGCAGNEIVQTPNLDRLATSGVRFTNTWCQSPICQPSRAALITGRYPHELGVMRNFGPDMDSSWPTFMKQLQNAGYKTANIGKTHYYAEGLSEPDGKKDMREHTARVAEFGFDHVVEEFDRYVHAMDGVDTPYTSYLKSEGVYETYRDQIKSIWRLTDQHWNGVTSPLTKELDLTSFLTREAQSWLARQTEAEPFFLQLSYVQPHVPLMADPEWADYYKEAIIPRGPTSNNDQTAPVWQDYLSWCGHHANSHLLSDDYVLTGARQYYAMISLIDESIGLLLEQLKRQSLLDDTWIIYSSDHGEMLGDHGLMAKFNFYKSSVQVPLIIRPAGGCEQNTSESLAAVVDIGPTLLDAAGAQPLPSARGRSLLPVITEQKDVRETLFSEIQKQSREEKAPTFRAVRNNRYRLTLETITNTPCELFDLLEDPSELNNRASDPEFKALRSELTDLLFAEITPA